MSEQEQKTFADVLDYRLANIENKITEVKKEVTDVNSKVDKIPDGFVSQREFTNFKQDLKEMLLARAMQKDVEELHKEVEDLQDNLKWITRAVIGAVVAAIIMFFMRGGAK